MPTRIARTVADAPSTNDRTFLFIGASLSALDLIPVAPWAISLRGPRPASFEQSRVTCGPIRITRETTPGSSSSVTTLTRKDWLWDRRCDA